MNAMTRTIMGQWSADAYAIAPIPNRLTDNPDMCLNYPNHQSGSTGLMSQLKCPQCGTVRAIHNSWKFSAEHLVECDDCHESFSIGEGLALAKQANAAAAIDDLIQLETTPSSPDLQSWVMRTKHCPHCVSVISAEASRCPMCSTSLQ